jgi:Fe-S-cluster containining protein
MSAEQPQDVERLQVSVDTPAGTVNMPVELASGYVPVTSIVPVMRQVGEKALALEQARALETGQAVSCRMGCAACCRPLVPLSPPEAFALHDTVQALPEPERQRLDAKFATAKARLEQAGLWSRLNDVAESERQLTDQDVEETNRSYYALRMPCPFLEDEVCSIYQDRPSACRELLVVSPAELCQDIVQNPVRPLPVPVRISTVLGMLWGELATRRSGGGSGGASSCSNVPWTKSGGICREHRQGKVKSKRGTVTFIVLPES